LLVLILIQIPGTACFTFSILRLKLHPKLLAATSIPKA
jgi:hypothetical protein